MTLCSVGPSLGFTIPYPRLKCDRSIIVTLDCDWSIPDNDDQYPGDTPLGTADNLCSQDEVLRGLTRQVDIVVLGCEHCLLYHANENHSSYPELKPASEKY